MPRRARPRAGIARRLARSAWLGAVSVWTGLVSAPDGDEPDGAEAGGEEVLVGGQAVMEGVMMKLPRAWAVTVRRASGELISRSDEHVPWAERWPLLKLPVLRGIAVLFSTLALGMRCLFFSTDVLAQDMEAADAGDGDRERESGADSGEPGASHPAGGMRWWEVALSVGFAVILFLGVFKALPLVAARGAARLWEPLGSSLGESIVSGIVLLLLFVTYLLAISWLPDIQRVFRYHGAEHKVVWLHEARDERTVERARTYSRLHPRCGTSFLFFVVVTSMVVWAMFPVDWGFWSKLGLRLSLFPLIVGLSYELIRLTARHRERLFFRVLVAPGLWSQRITTRPPDDDMLEVSLHSLGLAEAVSHGRQAPSH